MRIQLHLRSLQLQVKAEPCGLGEEGVWLLVVFAQMKQKKTISSSSTTKIRVRVGFLFEFLSMDG